MKTGGVTPTAPHRKPARDPNQDTHPAAGREVGARCDWGLGPGQTAGYITLPAAEAHAGRQLTAPSTVSGQSEGYPGSRKGRERSAYQLTQL